MKVHGVGTAPFPVDTLGDYKSAADGRLVRQRGGIGWITTAFFIVADMAGSGIVALPDAIINCSFWPGIAILVSMTLMTTCSGVLLGRAWEVMLQRFPIYRTHCRKPYAEMGYRVLGIKMRNLVSICVFLTNYGATTVFLLLCAKNVSEFLRAVLGWRIGTCAMIFVLAAALLPVTFLKSPQDFSLIVIFGMLSTGGAVLAIFVGAGLDAADCAPHRGPFPSLHVDALWLALGTILFSFGGHSTFPTIQHDMRRPADFHKSNYLAFALILLMYLVVICTGSWIYGDSLHDSVTNSIQTVWIQQLINVLITAHCLLTITLIINPLNQEIEEWFKIPQGFGVKRLLARTGVMVAVVVLAESVPKFSAILGLIGGSTITLTSLIFPCLFYLYLSALAHDERCGDKATHKPVRVDYADKGAPDECVQLSLSDVVARTGRWTLALCGTIILLGTISGIAATYTSVKALAGTNFVQPCYLRGFADPVTRESARQVTVCCGAAQNISRFGDDFCVSEKLVAL